MRPLLARGDEQGASAGSRQPANFSEVHRMEQDETRTVLGAVSGSPMDRLWAVQRINLFGQFDALELEAATRMLHLREIGAREPISLPRDSRDVFFLIKGRAKVTRTDLEQGREVVLYIVRTGEVFGLLPAVDEQYADSRVIALQRCVVGYIREPEFRLLLKKMPDLRTEVVKIIQNRAIKIENRLVEMLFRGVPCRIARLLLRLAREFPTRRSCGMGIDVPLTQKDIAGLVAASRSVVSLTLNELRRRRMVAYHGRGLCLHDREGLEALAR